MSEIVYEDVFNPQPFLESVKRIEAQGENSSGEKVIHIPVWLIILASIGLGILLIHIKPKVEEWWNETFVSEQQNNRSKQNPFNDNGHPKFHAS